MTIKTTTNTRFSPEWDSEDWSGHDTEPDPNKRERDPETGAALGILGGAVVGIVAGGPVGAIVGAVAGGVAAGFGVAAVENADKRAYDAEIEAPAHHDATLRSSNDARLPVVSAPRLSTSASDSPAANGIAYSPDRAPEASVNPEPAMPPIAGTTLVTVYVAPDETESYDIPTFVLSGYNDAKSVAVSGTFNDWSPTGIPLAREDEQWVASIDIPAGAYAYKFIVDGVWITDPGNPETVLDSAGNRNSIGVIY